MVIQNTGLLESGDSLRGTAVRMGAPIPFVATWRGLAKLERAGMTGDEEKTIEALTRPDVDSTALLTGPTLSAWGIPWRTCTGDEDPVLALRETIVEARTEERPVALVLGRAFT